MEPTIWILADASSTPVIVSAVGTLAIAVGIAIKVILLPDTRGGIRITNEQGSAQIRDSFIAALQRDLERKNEELERKDSEIREIRDRKNAEINELRSRVAAMEERFGTRHDDPQTDPPQKS